MKEVSQFFEFVNLREHIRIAKENGAPRFMWTQDPVLQQYRFCNVFREDDRTTRYFRDTVREPLRNDPKVLLATIGWRWFNRIETCSRLTLHDWKTLDTNRMRQVLRDCSPVVTGAFLVLTPSGTPKLEGVLCCIAVAENEVEWFDLELSSLEESHRQLMRIPYLGRFMAYEVVTDLRHTYLLEDATDIMTWASAGPGACRGAGRVLTGDPTRFPYGTKRSQEEILVLMRKLLGLSLAWWDWPDRPWEMREVEHCLCEYDKYRRAQNGHRLKRKYQPS